MRHCCVVVDARRCRPDLDSALHHTPGEPNCALVPLVAPPWPHLDGGELARRGGHLCEGFSRAGAWLLELRV
jgi:hypothetical protein